MAVILCEFNPVLVNLHPEYGVPVLVIGEERHTLDPDHAVEIAERLLALAGEGVIVVRKKDVAAALADRAARAAGLPS